MLQHFLCKLRFCTVEIYVAVCYAGMFLVIKTASRISSSISEKWEMRWSYLNLFFFLLAATLNGFTLGDSCCSWCVLPMKDSKSWKFRFFFCWFWNGNMEIDLYPAYFVCMGSYKFCAIEVLKPIFISFFLCADVEFPMVHLSNNVMEIVKSEI